MAFPDRTPGQGSDQGLQQGDPRAFFPDPRKEMLPLSLGDALLDSIDYQGSLRPIEEVMADIRAIDETRIGMLAISLVPYSAHGCDAINPLEAEIVRVARWSINQGLVSPGSVFTGAPIEFIEVMTTIRQQFLIGDRVLFPQRETDQ